MISTQPRLTHRQQMALAVIHGFISQNQCPPTFKEVCDRSDLIGTANKAELWKLICALRAKGMLVPASPRQKRSLVPTYLVGSRANTNN